MANGMNISKIQMENQSAQNENNFVRILYFPLPLHKQQLLILGGCQRWLHVKQHNSSIRDMT